MISTVAVLYSGGLDSAILLAHQLAGGAAEELVLYGVRVVPRKLLDSGYEFRYPELRQALQAVLAGEVGS